MELTLFESSVIGVRIRDGFLWYCDVVVSHLGSRSQKFGFCFSNVLPPLVRALNFRTAVRLDSKPWRGREQYSRFMFFQFGSARVLLEWG